MLCTFKLIVPFGRFASRKQDKARRGVTAVEFALIAPMFFMLLIGTTEMSLILLAEHLLENATYNASRTSKTGYIEEGKTQLQTVTDVLLGRLSGLNPLIDPNKVSISYAAYADLSDVGQPEQGVVSLGAASQIVVYTISYPWKVFTPLMNSVVGNENGIVTLSSRIVVRNEPYD